MNDRTKNVKTFFAICAVAIAILAGFTILHALSFHIISTEPAAGNVSTISPFFKVNFSQPISSTDVTVTSIPSGLIGKVSVSGKVLTIPFQGLLIQGKTYTITIVSVSSTHGKKLTNITYTFSPTYVPSSSLPKDQQQALIKRQDTSDQLPANPITKDLPYETTDFILSVPTTSITSNSKFPLLAVITPSEADMGNESAAVAQYEQEVTTYITSLGLSPANYNITYRVQTP